MKGEKNSRCNDDGKICQNRSKSVSLPKFAKIYQNLLKSAKICQNLLLFYTVQGEKSSRCCSVQQNDDGRICKNRPKPVKSLPKSAKIYPNLPKSANFYQNLQLFYTVQDEKSSRCSKTMMAKSAKTGQNLSKSADICQIYQNLPKSTKI